MDDLIEVCDKCFRASCWQGVFYCYDYKNADTVFVERETLRELAYEHPEFYDIENMTIENPPTD
jgi:hypothetical protein